MSPQKSTIDRFSTPATREPASSTPATRPSTRQSPTGALSGTAVVRRSFGLLERWSPGTGGRLAQWLWFRVPARPSAPVRERRTPPGGEPFEVALDGRVIRGRAYGEWGNPTAYLVHGWGGWWQQLAAHVQPMVDAGLCVVAFDAPSHGSSDRGKGGARTTTVVEMAEALAAVVLDFGRPTVIVAHSLGAMVALHARQLGVVADSYAVVAPPHAVEPMVRLFGAVLGVGPHSQEHQRRLIERRVGLPLREFDLVAQARRIAAPPPLLAVHDQGDPETPASGSVALTDAWPGSELLLTEGLGHRRILWQPEVVRAVAAFAAQAAEAVRRSSR